MSSDRGGIPRWLSGINVAAIVVSLAVVIPQQVLARRQLSTPQNLCVCYRLSPTAVKLTWGDSGALAQNYILQRSTTQDFSSSSFEIRIAKNVLEFVDESQQYSTTFYYRIASEAGPDRSTFSAPVRARNGWLATKPSAPNAPTNVGITSVGDGLRITWSDTSSNETGFWIQRSGDNGSTWEFRASLAPNTTAFTDTDPPPAAPVYRVWSFNSGGTSPSYSVQWVNPRVATPASLVPTNLASQATQIASGLASAVPSNVTTVVPSNINTLVPSNVTTYTGIASAVPSNLTTYTGIASAVPTGITSATSIATVVPSNPATLVPSINPTALIPDTNKIKLWVGLYTVSPPSAIVSFWILPTSCLGSGCPPPKNPICSPIPFVQNEQYCYLITTV